MHNNNYNRHNLHYNRWAHRDFCLHNSHNHPLCNHNNRHKACRRGYSNTLCSHHPYNNAHLRNNNTHNSPSRHHHNINTGLLSLNQTPEASHLDRERSLSYTPRHP